MSCRVMGVLNVTPDSFSDGGRFADVDAAVAHGRAMVAAGAAIVDVGGESTRPGAAPVDVDTEIARVVPVVQALAGEVTVSIDTRNADTARAAVAAGATVINDVSASLASVAAEVGATWICMHMAGRPTDMQDDPHYDDVVAEVESFLLARAAAGRAAGVAEVWIDPGIGFGKTVEHNLDLLASIDRLASHGHPVVVGTSRKSTLGVLHARTDGVTTPVPPHDRIEGSLATAVWAAHQGASWVRVHDVAETADAMAIVGDG